MGTERRHSTKTKALGKEIKTQVFCKLKKLEEEEEEGKEEVYPVV